MCTHTALYFYVLGLRPDILNIGVNVRRVGLTKS